MNLSLHGSNILLFAVPNHTEMEIWEGKKSQLAGKICFTRGHDLRRVEDEKWKRACCE